ncbi:hypothetical protein B0H63DRAFT_480894 [Podospora didyma]|uniref:3-dehydrosphinganine reductase n=1 Tax=Podospora didyma TaxID=330526 RepID=A0AAE0KF64_9PEZI|nr:hypothetical protein B0H63DRAFT_480894 [Podospora didyma]
MGALFSKNQFPVDGRVVLITGGSRGTGLEAGRQLAANGADVVVVARDAERLQQAVFYIQEGAIRPETQRFHFISADLTDPSEAQRIMGEVVAWNLGSPPDIVWCCAGATHPTLFIDTPVDQFRAIMDANYFTAVYMAQAALQAWLRPPLTPSSSKTGGTTAVQIAPPPLPRHLIFTASFLSFYSITGYSPYSPSKAALRSLSDSLSQEMNLYAGAYPDQPRVRIHTVFPATIYTESYAAEDLIKTDVTKKLEEADEGQTAEEVARLSIRGLEAGQELIATDLLTRLVMTTVMGGSVRGGIWRGLGTWIVGCFISVVMLYVRATHDSVARKWGKENGASGMKRV